MIRYIISPAYNDTSQCNTCVHISFHMYSPSFELLPLPSGKPRACGGAAIGTLLIPNALFMMTGLNDQNCVSIFRWYVLEIFGNVICINVDIY